MSIEKHVRCNVCGETSKAIVGWARIAVGGSTYEDGGVPRVQIRGVEGWLLGLRCGSPEEDLVLSLLQSIVWHVCYALEWLLSGCQTPPYERIERRV